MDKIFYNATQKESFRLLLSLLLNHYLPKDSILREDCDAKAELICNRLDVDDKCDPCLGLGVVWEITYRCAVMHLEEVFIPMSNFLMENVELVVSGRDLMKVLADIESREG